jgi:hypothetical protein
MLRIAGVWRPTSDKCIIGMWPKLREAKKPDSDKKTSRDLAASRLDCGLPGGYYEHVDRQVDASIRRVIAEPIALPSPRSPRLSSHRKGYLRCCSLASKNRG